MRTFNAAPFRGKKLRFRASVRFEKIGPGGFLQSQEAHLWMRVDRANNAGVGFFDNMEKRPIVLKEYHPYEIVGMVSDDAEYVNIGLLLLGNGKAWMRDVTVEVFEGTRWIALPDERLSLRMAPVAEPLDPVSEKALLAELDAHAIPLKTVEAGHGFDDMLSLDRVIGDARIVALGEASHGTREFFQMKHRILEYLVEKKGFTVFAIEANWPESESADRYIKTGTGDLTAALDAMYFWTWHTREVADMIEWMRAYNRRPGNHPQVTFTSFDMQLPRFAAKQVLDYLGKADRQNLERAAAAYAHVTNLHAGPAVSEDASTRTADRIHADEISKLLDGRRAALITASSAAAFLHARQCARIVQQAAEMNASVENPGGVRDRAMAENVRWLSEEAYPHQKIVLWAHNGHIGDSSAGGIVSMGHHLRQMFGESLVTIGFGFDYGQIRAITMSEGKMTTGPVVLNVPPAVPGSAEALLRQANAPLYLIDFRGLPAGSPLAVWLDQDQLFRQPGAAYDPTQPEIFFAPTRLSKTFDSLIFIRKSHASLLLPNGVPPKLEEKH
jgi:erythromycin esterase